MAKKPSQTAIWKEAAKRWISELQRKLSFVVPKDKLETAELWNLIPLARRDKTAKGRHSVYQAVRQERITDLILRQGEVEWIVKRSFAKLIPDTKMKNDDKGREQYDDLVEIFGQQWVNTHVFETIRQIPSHKVHIREYSGGIFVDTEEIIAAHTETEYTFTGKGKTMEQLAWTEALGNKIKVEVSDISTRAKEGKKRRGQK